MIHFLIFTGLSLFALGFLALIKKKKGTKTGILASLFLLGILLAVPFVLIEHLAFSLKYYVVILAFIAVELVFVTIEHKWEYLHNLLHHNIRELRLLSFFIVSIGFTYFELSAHVLSSHQTTFELLASIPLKAIFALFTHTVLTSSAAVLTTTESVVEHFFLFAMYYLRLVFISVSHYLYTFFTEHKWSLLLIPFMAYNIYILLKHKKYLDRKGEVFA